jgi:hypothetical protein
MFISYTFQPSPFLFPLPAFCQDDELECANHECVSRDLWCDGEADCSDSSDEWDCGKLLVSTICPALSCLSPIYAKWILNYFTDFANQVHLFCFTVIKVDSGDSWMLFPSHRKLPPKLLLYLKISVLYVQNFGFEFLKPCDFWNRILKHCYHPASIMINILPFLDHLYLLK